VTRAIVFVPSDDFDPHATRCVAYAEERHYELVGVVRDDWNAVLRLIGDGQVGVVVVSDEAHLDPERQPRVEVVANQYSSRWEKRTRVIRRVWGG
jgi:hypothetical protein